MASKATKLTGAAIASAVVATLPAASEGALIFESNPALNSGNNGTFPGATVQAENTFDTIQGSVSNFGDEFDFFNYGGLQPGSSFDVLVELLDQDLDADVLSLAPALLDSLSLASPGTVSGHLTGTVPGDGHVVVRLSTGSEQGSEGYRITLTGTRASVPVPASVALVTAGLVALGGLHVARRRRAG